MNINSPEEGSEDDLLYVNGSFLDRFIISVDTLIHPNYIILPRFVSLSQIGGVTSLVR